MTSKRGVPWRLGRAYGWQYLLFATLVLFCLSYQYYPFFSDDALISLRYSDRWVSGQGLTWTAGERVEGYTDLLWVLINGLPAWLGLDGIWAARVLDFLGGVSALVFVSLSPRSLELHGARATFGAGFLCTLVPLAVWAIGGLEHAFMVGLLSLALLLVERGQMAGHRRKLPRFLLAGLPLAALALSRADGIVLVAGCVVGSLFAGGLSLRSLRHSLALVLPAAVAVGGQLIFRIAYYGDYVPNTARAKVAFRWERVSFGWEHVSTGVLASGVGLAFALVLATQVGRKSARRLWPPLMMCLFWMVYLVSVGGDIFPGWRQLLLGVAPLAFVAAAGAERLARRYRFHVAWILVPVVVFGAHVHVQMRDSENQRAKLERWEWDGLSIGPLLKTAFAGKEPLLAVDAAGALPYWSELPALDLLGLNDRYLTRHPPPGFGQKNAIGHELGDPEYFLERKPDIFAFCNAAGALEPCFWATRRLVARQEFRRDYRLVRVRGATGNRAVGHLHIRLRGRIGITERANLIDIPAYFLASRNTNAVATLGPGGKLSVDVSARAPGILEEAPIGPGRYRVEVISDGPALVGVRCGERSLTASSGEMVFEVRKQRAIDVLVSSASSKRVRIEGLQLTKTNAAKTHDCSSVRDPVPLALLQSHREGAHWLAPPALSFDSRGLTILLGDTQLTEKLQVTADNNDSLLVRFFEDSAVVGRVVVPSVRKPGMRKRAVPIPRTLIGKSVSRALILPRRGDGNYSLSGFTLIGS